MKVISLINMKGGVGKTTLSINIADCLVRRHNKKVLVIDVDPQFNATQSLMSTSDYVSHLKEEKDTIVSIFDRLTRTTVGTVDGFSTKTPKTLSDVEPIRVKNNLYLLPGNLDLYRIEMVPGEGRENKLSKYVAEVSSKHGFDFVIIDTPPTPSIWMTSALIASDYYVIPVKPDPLSFTGIDLLESIITDKRENLDLKIECAGLILTMTNRTTLVYREAQDYISSSKWNRFKMKFDVPQRTSIARNQTSKNFILDLQDNETKIALTGIVDEILRRTQK